MKEDIKILVIPDVHGRIFWKDAIEKFPKKEWPDLKIIFLGDYLDPYEHEGIFPDEALLGFNNILKIAKEDKRIQLLLGNHDWHYLVKLDKCRIDRENQELIKNLFLDNLDLFKIAKVEEVNGIRYLFTHAGVLKRWLSFLIDFSPDWAKRQTKPERQEFNQNIHNFDYQKDDIEKFLNQFLDFSDDQYKTFPLSMISEERGGWDRYGSPIWADIHEHLWAWDHLDNYFQVFAHSGYYPRGLDSYIISPDGKPFAMIDSGQAFVINSEGELKPLRDAN